MLEVAPKWPAPPRGPQVIAGAANSTFLAAVVRMGERSSLNNPHNTPY
jgi:hypothetical protein